MCGADCFLGFLAILFPPLPVWVKCGICSADSIINLLLCLLGYIPGLLHAWYIIAKFPDTLDYERVPQQDGEGGRVTYVFVNQQPGSGQQQQQGRKQHKPNQPHGGMNYGTASDNNNAESSSTAPHKDGEGSGQAPAPPTYAEAVKGDHKVQTQD
ncbi:Uu.00g017940.m01.CDS01 [Anthostomella pinea]|uniref:Uu.00g017940.m01.CDS01 n=1 Tax=Anthostomella pinea TaxID=933095 RepID=A0AAI8VZJ9_9PEZI|nr:Uu.00g017940.m01.CDS01 [Anthostomella pinea]